MSEWSSVPLSQLIEPGKGVSYGIVQPGSPVRGGIPIVRVGDVKDGRIATATPLCVSPEIEANYARTRLRGGELIITVVGSVGQTAIVPKNLSGWNVARAIAVLPIQSEVGAYWVQLALKAPSVRSRIDSRLNTTVQPTLNLGDLAELPILLPPRVERDRIISILGALEDKIELNRRMNETLEAMVRAIFNDWFVDFGPTRAKIEGRSPYLPPEDWALFPDRLDDDGKPEGWRTFRLDQLAVHHTRTMNPFDAPEEEFEHFSLPSFDSAHSPAIDRGDVIKSNKTLVPSNAVLLSKLNPEIERVWIPEPASDRLQICSTEFLAFTPTAISSTVLLFGLFKERSFRAMLQSMVTGTSKSHQRISPPSLLQKEVLVGSVPAFGRYANIAHGLLLRALANRAESRTLAQARDLLLPKLMSGEIRIRDAEKAVGGIV